MDGLLVTIPERLGEKLIVEKKEGRRGKRIVSLMLKTQRNMIITIAYDLYHRF